MENSYMSTEENKTANKNINAMDTGRNTTSDRGSEDAVVTTVLGHEKRRRRDSRGYLCVSSSVLLTAMLQIAVPTVNAMLRANVSY